MAQTNVVVIDADSARRHVLVGWLHLSEHFVKVAEGGDLAEVWLPHDRGARADLLVVDLDQPEMSLLRTWILVKATYPAARVVAITRAENETSIGAVFLGGFAAIHPDDLTRGTLLAALDSIASSPLLQPPLWLIDRLRTCLALSGQAASLCIGSLRVDSIRYEVWAGERLAPFSMLEVRVIAYLASNRGRYVAAEELLDRVWRSRLGEGGTLDQVKSGIKRIRAKLSRLAEANCLICSKRGKGYSIQDLPQAAQGQQTPYHPPVPSATK